MSKYVLVYCLVARNPGRIPFPGVLPYFVHTDATNHSFWGPGRWRSFETLRELGNGCGCCHQPNFEFCIPLSFLLFKKPLVQSATYSCTDGVTHFLLPPNSHSQITPLDILKTSTKLAAARNDGLFDSRAENGDGAGAGEAWLFLELL